MIKVLLTLVCGFFLSATVAQAQIGPAPGGAGASLSANNTFTGTNTFSNGLNIGATGAVLSGSSSGTTTVKASATASGTLTLPAVTDTVATLNTPDQVQAGGVHLTSYGNSTGSVTVDCGKNPQQYIVNGGAFTITAPTADGNCILLMRNNASAGAVTFSGFTVGSNTGASLTTTSGNIFSIFIWRITDGTGPVAGYNITAHQ